MYYPRNSPKTIMNAWSGARVLELSNIEVSIVLGSMAGVAGVGLAIAVTRGGGLGSLPRAMLNAEQIRQQIEQFRVAVHGPVNLNFFCHTSLRPDPERDAKWHTHLAPYYVKFGVDLNAQTPAVNRASFDEVTCTLVEELKSEVMSFHFGSLSPELQARAKVTGAKIVSATTTVEETRWLETRGVNTIIVMGGEADDRRGMFLAKTIESQVGTFALVPQVADAVKVPVITANDIGDARGVVAVLALGTSAVQIGMAYMLSPEVKTSAIHRVALKQATDADTTLTNLFTGRPARGIVNRLMCEIGPMGMLVPAFPTAGGVLAPLRVKTGPTGSGDSINLRSGQADRLTTEDSAEAIARCIVAQALERLT